MKNLLFFIVSLFIFVKLNASDTIHFDIILFSDKIGTMTITHELNADGSEHYTLESKSQAKVLWIDKSNETHYDVVFKDGKLFSVRAKEIEDGEVKRWSNITYDGSKYVVDSYKGKTTFTQAPVFSVMSLYFKGVKGDTQVFDEMEGDFRPVQQTDANTWEFKSDDGTRNVYHFENGKIQNTEFHVSIATVKMIRSN